MMKLFLVFSTAMVCWTIIHVKADNWKEHQLKYPTKAKNGTDEFQKCRKNFDKTDSRIQSHNKRSNSTFKMGHNQFSSMDDNEKKSFLSNITFVDTNLTEVNNAPSLNTTLRQSFSFYTSLNLTSHSCMPPVKNQGKACGSAWAFSVTPIFEFRRCFHPRPAVVSLSEQQLLDCTPNCGCTSGHPFLAIQYLSSAGGLATSASYPYTATKGNCRFSSSMNQVSITKKLPTWFNFAEGADATKNSIKSYLSNFFLVPLLFDVVQSFFNYQSGIYSDSSCKNKTAIRGQHSATAVGYGTQNGVDYWILRNSWGTQWGNSGYFLFQRNVNMCNIETYLTGTYTGTVN